MKVMILTIGILLSSITMSMFGGRAEEDDFPVLKGPYLGQDPPGTTPELFAPGIISTSYYERSIVFNPDLDELFFQMRSRGFTTFLMTMQMRNGVWNPPEIAFFSGLPEYKDDCPFITHDGTRLYFSSRRPISGDEGFQKEPDLWVIRRGSKGWGRPEHLGSSINSPAEDHYPTVSTQGSIYFSSNRSGNYEIYVSQYSAPERFNPAPLPSPVNTSHFEGHPFIAADESYLIFSSDRPGQLGNADLYISFRGKDGTWSEPVNMGDKINTPYHEAAPYVTPDGKYFFFCSFRPNPQGYTKYIFKYREDIQKLLPNPDPRSGDIYWVDTHIFKNLNHRK